MDKIEFEAIGVAMFPGEARWGRKFAEKVGISPAQVSKIRSGLAQVSPAIAEKVRAAYGATTTDVGADAYEPATEKFSSDDATTVNFAGTKLAGEATHLLQLTARALTKNGKPGPFVKAINVNPDLFMETFLRLYGPGTVPAAVPAPTVNGAPRVAPVSDDSLTDEEILARIQARADVLSKIVSAVIYKGFPSMVVSGPAGVGKSYLIMEALRTAKLENSDFYYDVVKGAVTAPGLYKALYKAKDGGVVVLDDSDSIFDSEDALNLLKAALDSEDERLISWRKESSWLADLVTVSPDDEEYDAALDEVRNFTFKGSVIFITNLDFKAKAETGKMAPHFAALISRSYYIDLAMSSNRAKSLRVRDIFVNGGMGTKLGLTEVEATEIADFIDENRENLTEVSLRMANLITKVFKTGPGWKEIILVTKTKG